MTLSEQTNLFLQAIIKLSTNKNTLVFVAGYAKVYQNIIPTLLQLNYTNILQTEKKESLTKRSVTSLESRYKLHFQQEIYLLKNYSR